MIALALRKFAKENGMRINRGVGYGNLHGYAAMLSEGMGYKEVVISLRFPDTTALHAFRKRVKKKSVRKHFQLEKMEIGSRRIHIRFLDHYGDTKNIRAFCKWFFPLLKKSGAQGTDTCPLCSQPNDHRSKWKKADRTVMLVHESCAEDYERKRLSKDLRRKDKESYAKGFAGAVLGGLLGCVFWISLLQIGYISVWGGIILGFTTFSGYDLFNGRQGRGKVPIVTLILLFCICFSNCVNLCLTFFSAFREHTVQMPLNQMLAFIGEQLKSNSELRHAHHANILASLLMGFVGTCAPLYRSWRRTRTFCLKDLN